MLKPAEVEIISNPFPSLDHNPPPPIPDAKDNENPPYIPERRSDQDDAQEKNDGQDHDVAQDNDDDPAKDPKEHTQTDKMSLTEAQQEMPGGESEPIR